PIAVNLDASLIHPDRSANVFTVRFSPDGDRLFTAGYPSRIVQIWDVANRKEIRRIDTPSGLPGSAGYAQITPGWSTLYVPVQKSSVRRMEREGKSFNRVEYGGEIRVWDVRSGKEKAPLPASERSGPSTTKIAPNGQLLVCLELRSYDVLVDTPKGKTVV